MVEQEGLPVPPGAAAGPVDAVATAPPDLVPGQGDARGGHLALAPDGEGRPPRGDGYRAAEEMIREALSEVYDPEIGIDIVSLGLVYGTSLDDTGRLIVDMTLTSPYCPMGGIIHDQVSAVCTPLPGVEQVQVNFVFKPPWDPRTMASDEAKLDLGIY